jgi:rhamnosyltransferase
MSDHPICSVVIRAYNEEKHIGRLLQGISQQTLKDVEVLLVDSGSSDRTIEIAREYGVTVVQIDPQDFTFGRSLNLGVRTASADLVVLASAHVYPVYPDWLEKMIEPFANPQVALTYGKQRGTDESKFSENQIFAQWFPDSQQPIQDHPFCNNANAAIRKSLWAETPYDESLPGLEDLDWANKMMLQNRIIRYVPEAEIIHLHHETPAGVFHRYQREGMAFKRIFPQERFDLWDFFRLSASNIIHDWREACNQKSWLGVWRQVVWFRTMQFWGTYQGYRQSGPLTWQLRQRFYYPNRSLPPAADKKRNVSPIDYSR